MFLRAQSIGRAAQPALAQPSVGRVLGVTSRGVFVLIEPRVIFLSSEHWRGPLTINVERPVDCALGEAVRLSATRLIFPASEVDLSSAKVWQAPDASTARQAPDEQLRALRHLAREVLARPSREENGARLAHLLDLPEKQALSAVEAARLAGLIQLRQSIRHADFDQATELIAGLLGLGCGLTPSGDDVMIGWLLAVNRWRRDQPWRELNQRVIDLAYQRTTTLSANLIECAAHGEADERLINVVDGLVTGTPSSQECVDYVLGWGHSSGRAALVGMALCVDADRS